MQYNNELKPTVTHVTLFEEKANRSPHCGRLVQPLNQYLWKFRF